MMESVAVVIGGLIVIGNLGYMIWRFHDACDRIHEMHTAMFAKEERDEARP